MARVITGYTGSKGNIPVYTDVADTSSGVQSLVGSGSLQPETNQAGSVVSYIRKNADGTVTRFNPDGQPVSYTHLTLPTNREV